jgi:hypothetical protein
MTQRGPSAGWWVVMTANAAGTNGLTCLPKHGGARDNKFLVTPSMIYQRCLTSAIARRSALTAGPSSSSKMEYTQDIHILPQLLRYVNYMQTWLNPIGFWSQTISGLSTVSSSLDVKMFFFNILQMARRENYMDRNSTVRRRGTTSVDTSYNL